MRYSIRSIFILILLAATTCLGLQFYARSQPLIFEPYSAELRDQALKNGQYVLITIYGNWDPSTSDPMRRLSRAVTIGVRGRNMLPLAADVTNNDPHATELMDELNVKAVPVIVIYDPRQPSDPKIIKGIPSERQIIDAISFCCN